MNYRLNKQVSNIMKSAGKEARDMGNNYIGSEHLLLGIIRDTSTSLSKLLAAQDLYYFQLKEELMVLFGLKDQEVDEVQVTQVVEDIMERSMDIAVNKQHKVIDAASLSLALLRTESCVAIEILHRYDLDEEDLLSQLEYGAKSELDKVNELRNMSTSGSHSDIVGREEELDFMISVLSRKDKANPLLIGEPGVGKTALVEKLAAMIQQKKVPSLMDSCIYELHLNSLVAGTKYRGDFEEKLQKIIQLLEKYPHVILFIDEIHQMIGAGKSEGSIDVSSVLKPYLARGAIRCIGATTIEEYEKHIEKDRALERRFQPIMIKEPKKEETFRMLKAKIKSYEEFHQVHVEEACLMQIVDYCDYYMPQRKFPDKAIDVLDLACVKAKNSEAKCVDDPMIRNVIEKLTDIPIASQNRLDMVEKQLFQSIIGQEEVLHKLMVQLKWIEEGVISDRPLGVWLFLGHPGVGKTMLIQQFNHVYFNQDDVITFDMNNFEHHLEHPLAHLRRSPYAIVSIINLHMAKESSLQYLKQSIEKGYMEHDIYKVDLRHCIIIMSGQFSCGTQGTLRFKEETDPFLPLRQMLGDGFMHVFDEIFLFRDLLLEEKVLIVKNMMKKWNKNVDDEGIQKAILQSTTLKEACHHLQKKIVKA